MSQWTEFYSPCVLVRARIGLKFCASSKRNRTLSSTLCRDDDDFANASMDEDVSEAEQNLLDALETLKSNDNYYYEAVGLQYDEDPSTGKISVKKLIEPEFKSFTFSEIFLYNKDDVALQILASKSPKERAEIVTNIAKQMKAGMKFGLNPRNARVLRILTFWGSLFAIGSGLTLVRATSPGF